MKTWVTSDTHFGHDKIRTYCNRPFSSVEEMDAVIIENWNRVVSPGDRVIHLGDFSFKDPEFYRKKLNGNIILCLGNHDRRNKLRGFNSIFQIFEFREKEQPIVCCHYAMRIWNKSHYGAWHLYGHSHHTLPDISDSLSLDVGMDGWNYTPVSLEQVAQKMAAKQWKSPFGDRK